MINLLWKLGLGLELYLRVAQFLHFTRQIMKTSILSSEFHRRYLLAKRTHQNDEQQNQITYYRSDYE